MDDRLRSDDGRWTEKRRKNIETVPGERRNAVKAGPLFICVPASETSGRPSGAVVHRPSALHWSALGISKEARVLLLHALVLDEHDAASNDRGLCRVADYAELKPYGFRLELHCFFDKGEHLFRPHKDVDHIDRLGDVGEELVGFLAEDGILARGSPVLSGSLCFAGSEPHRCSVCPRPRTDRLSR